MNTEWDIYIRVFCPKCKTENWFAYGDETYGFDGIAKCRSCSHCWATDEESLDILKWTSYPDLEISELPIQDHAEVGISREKI